MIKTFFDMTIASFDTLQEVKKEECLKADIITIAQSLDGQGMYHSTSMRWKRLLSGITMPTELIRSKKERKAVTENKTLLENSGFIFKTLPFTEELFEEFLLLYKDTTLKRDRALSIDAKQQILSKIKIGQPTFLVGMFKEDALESGLAFHTDKEHAFVSLGAKKKFPELRGGIGGILEVELVQKCLELNLHTIVHGRTMNPAGITGSAGIFEFKARYGYSAYPEDGWQTMFVRNPNVGLSDLVFITIIENELGYLIVSEKDPHELIKRYQTHKIKKVVVKTPQQVQQDAINFLETLA